MRTTDPKHRLSEVVYGSRLSGDRWGTTIVSLPVSYSDISSDVLFAVMEAVHSYSPSHIRQMVPFVLHALEQNRTDLFTTGYFEAFFLHVNYEFSLPMESRTMQGGDQFGIRYSPEYRQNWVAPTISAMNGFEHGWAYEWTCDVLEKGVPEVTFNFQLHLKMFARILAMALGQPENEAPVFEN